MYRPLSPQEKSEKNKIEFSWSEGVLYTGLKESEVVLDAGN